MGTDGCGDGDWGWSSHFWKKLSFSIGRDVFGVDVGIGVVRQETGTGDVLAFLVRLEAIGGLDVVAHGTEDVLVKVSVCADEDDPFDAVAGGTGEEEGSGEFTVTEKHFSIHRHVGDVVEVQAERSPRMSNPPGAAALKSVDSEAGYSKRNYAELTVLCVKFCVNLVTS